MFVDVFKASGAFQPFADTFENVYPSNEMMIQIQIIPRKGPAFLSGIQLKPQASGDDSSTLPIELPKQKEMLPENQGKFRIVYPLSSYKPTERMENCALWAKGKLWLLGGKGKGLEVASFDPRSRQWINHGVPTDESGNLVELSHCQCVAIGPKIYAVGCWYGNWPSEKTHEKVWVFDINAHEWSLEPHPWKKRHRGGGAAIVYQEKIYFAAGSTGGHGNTTKLLPFLDMYDPKTKIWTTLPNIPDPRDHTQGAIVQDLFCVVGGRDGSANNYMWMPVTNINCYNITERKWYRMAELPTPRSMAATAPTCDGKIMIAGGEGTSLLKNGKWGPTAFSRVDFFDPLKNELEQPVFLAHKRHGTGAAASDCSCGNIYVSAGAGAVGDKKPLNDIEVWSPDGIVRYC